ncbi:hypothetical protein [Fusobacterium perfoetens]|uniref:hypothetical protein n=1 Tax=Fusobacterium perfoetens TaxID=852 RepID=UPI0004882501|nr:hypothetical protein [Fusobacterium perfoetens]
MKNKKYLFIAIFITSLLFIIFSYKDMMIYYYVKMGNKNYYSKNYDKAREYYEKALNIKDDYGIRINLIINDYEAKEYEKVLKNPVNAGFLKGNSIVKLSENKEKNNSNETSKENNLEKSLEYYKSAMIENSDMNIKKNYEIVLKKLENNQQNQNNQDKNQDKQDKQNNKQDDKNKKDNQQQNNQDKNNQNNSQQNQSNNNDKQNQNNNQDKQEQDQNNNQQNQENNQQQDKNQNNDNQQNNQDSQNSQNQDKQNDNQNNKQQQNTTNSQTQSFTDIEKARDKKELEMVLKKLEGNEKQSFKNNERLIGVGKNDTKNRW